MTFKRILNEYMIFIPIVLTVCYLILYWIAGMVDPGLMKRNYDCFGVSELPIKVVHKGFYKNTKLCYTCNIARPFRSSHCKDCDNCIVRMDHHCPWLGGCVGKRNYIFFYFYLLFLNLNNFFMLVVSLMIAYNKSKSLEKKVSIILLHCLPSLFTLVYLLIIMFFTTGLFYNHTKLIVKNITTKEELKKLVHSKIGNPYNRGVCFNCADFFCRRKRDPPLNVLKQLQKKEKVLKSTGPVVLKPKGRRQRTRLNTLSNTKSDNILDRSRFYSIDLRNKTMINNADTTDNNSSQERIRKRNYSMAIGNKRLYHAMKNLTLKNIEIGIIDEANEREDSDNDYNKNLLIEQK